MVKKIGANIGDVLKNIWDNHRVQSFVWRTGMMILAIIIQQVIASMSDWAIPAEVTVILGLILGEISKMINNILSGK